MELECSSSIRGFRLSHLLNTKSYLAVNNVAFSVIDRSNTYVHASDLYRSVSINGRMNKKHGTRYEKLGDKRGNQGAMLYEDLLPRHKSSVIKIVQRRYPEVSGV